MKKLPVSKLLLALLFALNTAIAFAAGSPGVERNTQKFIEALDQAGAELKDHPQ